jgi:hypothetical protein
MMQCIKLICHRFPLEATSELCSNVPRQLSGLQITHEIIL